MGKIIKNGIEYGGSSNSAENINYDDTKNVKTVINSIDSNLKNISEVVTGHTLRLNDVESDLDTKATKYTSKGSATQPVYIDSDGVPTAISYTVGKSVPSDAKFTDTNTTYSAGTGLSLSGTTFSVNYGSSAGTACQGNDSRLSNARPASDVYSWAKASSKPSYSWDEITGKPGAFTPYFANGTWYTIGDDVRLGDHNVGGGLGIMGANGNTRLDFCKYGDASVYKSIIFDGSTLYLNGNCDYASSAGNADTLDGNHASAFASASHSHNYLPLSGGTLTGSISMNGYQLNMNGGKISTAQVIDGTSACPTLHICGYSYLNLRSAGIQCRNYGDTAWSGISASSFTNQSSLKYKKNIEDMTDEVAKSLLDYRVVSYDYINEADGTNCLGLIAEEVAEICEYPVIRDSEGNPDKIDYSRFVPQLIRMVQIQQNEINYLKSLILQNKN